MGYPIKTNQVLFMPDIQRLNSAYDVYALTTSEKYFKSGAEILDLPSLSGKISALLFEKGNQIIVLTEISALSVPELKREISATAEKGQIRIEKIGFEKLEPYRQLQLLLNALGNYNSSMLRFSNLTGHLYCFHPNWLKHSGKKDDTYIWQVPCLDVRISKEMRLNLSVHTFTSVKLRKKIVFDKRKFNEYPQYIMTTKNTLRRSLDTDADDAFIIRQLDGKKTNIPFLEIRDYDSFERSKMGVLCRILKDFEKKYKGLASLSFEEISDYDSLDFTRACAKASAKKVAEVLLSAPVRILDTIGDEYSQRFCEEIQLLISQKYGCHATIGKRIQKDALNIRLIHNAEYYDGIADPHQSYEGFSVQHVTFENFAGCAEHAIDTIIHELAIKKDLAQSKITLFDWQSLGYTADVAFGIPAEINGDVRYVFMTIAPDGQFSITEEVLDLFNMSKYQECTAIFEDAKTKGENVLGLIRLADGTINVIKDTGWITIPEIAAIADELALGNTKLRGKEKRDELLSASLDVKTFRENGAGYYFVGMIGNGMKWTINRAANIRKIEAYGDEPLILEDLMPLMNISFVRNGQLTVVPFPFKYLREYVLSRQK